MKKRLMVIGVVSLVVVSLLLFSYARRSRKSESIRTTGIVEGVEINISTMVPGTISKQCCKEGDAVRKGDTVIELESHDLKASVQGALAAVERAKAEVMVANSVVSGSTANLTSAEADIENARADVDKTRAQMEESKRHMDRLNALYEQGMISKESFGIAMTEYDTAVATYNSSRARVAAAISRREAAAAQLRTAESQLTSVRASVAQSEANLSYAQAKLAQTVIKSPISGTVIFKALEEGEWVSPGMTILTIVDLGSLYIRIDLEETVVGGVALHDNVKATTEGAPDRVLKGTISEIGRYAEFATQRDVTRGRQDIKTFRVKIAIDNPGGFLKPGMTVEVEIPKRTQRNGRKE